MPVDEETLPILSDARRYFFEVSVVVVFSRVRLKFVVPDALYNLICEILEVLYFQFSLQIYATCLLY